MFHENAIIVHPSEFTKKRIDSCINLGINTLGIHPEGGKNAAYTLKMMLERIKTDEFKQLVDYAHKNSLKIEYVMHASSFLLDRSLFISKPDFFRMDKTGIRKADGNLCVSSQEALSLISDNAKELAISLYGSTERFHFWPDDIRGLKCNCGKCKNYSASDQQLIFQNAILNGIKTVIPNAKVSYLAYFDSVYPPSQITPNEGIFLEYAPFEKYVSKQNEELIKTEYALIPKLLSFFGEKDSTVLEYWIDNSLFSGWKKPPKKLVTNEVDIKKDIDDYILQGFENITTFACFLGDDYEKLYGEADISPFTNAFPKKIKE